MKETLTMGSKIADGIVWILAGYGVLFMLQLGGATIGNVTVYGDPIAYEYHMNPPEALAQGKGKRK